MEFELRNLLMKVKSLLGSDELAKELKKIRDAYEIEVKSDTGFTFGHTFSRESFGKFEEAVRDTTRDQTEGFQQYVKKLIVEKDVNQTMLSTRSGIKESALSRYIKGQREPSVEMLFRIALGLNLNLVETEILLRKRNRGFKEAPLDAVIIEAIKQQIYDYLKIEAVLRKLTNGRESLLTTIEQVENSYNEEDWEIEITD